MEVQIISETVQKFDGESFYLCGSYFQHKGKRLHRTVWEAHNGEIPAGYHVHHIDGDKRNNQIENLALLKGEDHLSRHMSSDERRAASRESVKKAIAAAPEWHHSEAGKAWHSQRGKENWKNRKSITYRCAWCGCEFESRDMSHRPDRFCCDNHKAAALRWRRKHEGQNNYPGRKS